MGSSYCLSSDKKTLQNEITVINIHEDNLEEKKIPASSNRYINTLIDKKNNKNDNHSNLTNLSNKYASHINPNNQTNKIEIKKVEATVISRTVVTKNKIVVLNNDVIVSGNEVNPEKIYIKKKLLGSGAFGEVWLVRHKNLERDFAMKIIKKRKNKSNEEKEILNEIEILKRLDHPKILKIIDFYSKVKKYYIITEYCPEGELFNEIIKVGRFDEGQTAFIINQILKAVSYCHLNQIIHRDIKPENIMITKREKNGCLQVKLIDFGTAKIFEKGQSENRYVGSSYYMAPEVLKRKYDEKCDLWSIGVIFYILLTGRPPFDGNDDEEILKNVEIGVYDKTSYPFPSLSSYAKDLINKLLQYDPKKRISAEEALEHPWFKTAEFKKKDKINTIPHELAMQLITNMTKYKSNNMLKCAVIAYLVHHLTNTEECMEASKLFNKIDLNSDGKIEKHELIQGLQKFWGMSEDEVKEKVEIIFANIDTDFNGFIEYEEFVRAAVNPSIFMSQNYLKFAFNYFDRDSSGDISFEEIKKRFSQNSSYNSEKMDSELKEIFDKIDINHDGCISLFEFCKMMKNIMES